MIHSFKTAFDDYVKNAIITEYDTLEGNLRFVKNNKKIIIIDVIYIKKCFRKKGILKNFLRYIVNYIKNISDVEFMIVSVLSKILYEYLLRFEYDGYKFKLVEDGFLLKINKI